MLFKYKALTNDGEKKEGTIEAINVEVAVSSLQRRGLVVAEIVDADKPAWYQRDLPFFNKVEGKDIVVLSQQMATLFEAQVSALRVFRLLADESENSQLRQILNEIADDIQAGSSMSKALAKHPNAFSPFYISMVISGEETGHLDQILMTLAAYLDRTYAVAAKARNALIYPAFVVATFIVVMILMMTMVIPKISTILVESGQQIPIYTQIVLSISNFLVTYGIFLLIGVIVGGIFFFRYVISKEGKYAMDHIKISIPIFGDFYRKLYLARIADNLSTAITSGITMVRGLELSASVVNNVVYEKILLEAVDLVKAGSSVSDTFAKYSEIPSIVVQMVKVGEETGELGSILKTIAKFYDREVTNAIDTIVGLIEPVMIVFLGLGVGVLLASVLIPIYNVAQSI